MKILYSYLTLALAFGYFQFTEGKPNRYKREDASGSEPTATPEPKISSTTPMPPSSSPTPDEPTTSSTTPEPTTSSTTPEATTSSTTTAAPSPEEQEKAQEAADAERKRLETIENYKKMYAENMKALMDRARGNVPNDAVQNDDNVDKDGADREAELAKAAINLADKKEKNKGHVKEKGHGKEKGKGKPIGKKTKSDDNDEDDLDKAPKSKHHCHGLLCALGR